LPQIENKEYMLRIKMAKDISITVDPDKIIDQAAVQVLQIMLTHNFSMKYEKLNFRSYRICAFTKTIVFAIFYRCVSVIRSFFPSDCFKQPLGINVNLWKGFYTSVRPAEMGFNLNIDGKYTCV
jgi:hypothetical protein